ncbi:FMN-dependent NADH-azoreductase [Paraburkholderia silviterrae]|uniref:FMN dependent NADH:quinone oxidoreductase n=1 Tax=Paraburkholderia silviterrae TaxID=2528715 RepID=A0A4R5M021_9BURK|nr:NAD(P)H-dependent oxidoreductase [Paraburkholderia silviterrae]TDG18278.1 FMN-dependent NADH-azoreductase [Paraburkholderia silviterrae]
MKLLHIDSSILGARSVSRLLSSKIVEQQRRLHPALDVVYRDLACDCALHFSAAHMAAWAGEALEGAELCSDLELGQEYLDELFEADIIVIGAPMYNLTVPSQLKAWIDRIVIAGETFTYDDTGAVRTLLPPGKKIIIASTRGNVYVADTSTAALEHHERFLKGVFAFLGLRDVTVVRAEGLALGASTRNAAICHAQVKIAAIRP